MPQVVLVGRLLAARRRANPRLPEAAVEDAARVVNRSSHPTLVENDRWLHGLLIAEGTGVVIDRANVVVMADEAQWSQHGFREGGPRRMRQALPIASIAGFTGTPIEAAGKSSPG